MRSDRLSSAEWLNLEARGRQAFAKFLNDEIGRGASVITAVKTTAA